EPVSTLYRPPPPLERLRPRQQALRLGSCRSHRQLRQFDLAIVDGERVMRRLVRVDSDDHIHGPSSGSGLPDGTAVGTPTYGLWGARSSLEPHRGEIVAESTSVGSHTSRRQALWEPSTTTSTTLRNRRANNSLKQA